MPQGKSNFKVYFTEDGYEICNTTLGKVISEAKRYINPKMENELKVFKKKIAYRFENKEIPDSFEFPKYQTHLVKIKNRSLSPHNGKQSSSRSGSQERKSDIKIIELVDLK